MSIPRGFDAAIERRLFGFHTIEQRENKPRKRWYAGAWRTLQEIERRRISAKEYQRSKHQVVHDL